MVPKLILIHYNINFIIFSAPPVSVQIDNIVSTTTAGENYLLTCSVLGAENLNPTITYRWIRNNSTQVGTNSNTLFFTPLRLIDAGSYVCEVIISSNSLTDIIAMNATSQDTRIQSEFFTIGSEVIIVCLH